MPIITKQKTFTKPVKPLLPFYHIKTTTTARFLLQDFSMLLLLLAFSMPSKLNMASKVEAFALAIVKALVSRFEEHLPSYKKNYSETQTRIDFIDPFFEALGSSLRFQGNTCCYLSDQTLNQFNHGLQR